MIIYFSQLYKIADRENITYENLPYIEEFHNEGNKNN